VVSGEIERDTEARIGVSDVYASTPGRPFVKIGVEHTTNRRDVA